jgi:D-serine deaminase-like pyridoxal phosphate-dependent protein
MAISIHDRALHGLKTPALVIDRESLEHNIARMAAGARRAGIRLRPHAKTHKSKHIAARQIDAGAVGIACATVAEAAALAAAGITGLLITSPVMGDAKFSLVAKLNRENGLAVVVDHTAQVEGLLPHLQAGDRPLQVIVDVDVGQARTGVTDLAHGLELAKAIVRTPQLVFAGIQGFAGQAQHIVDPTERRSAAAGAATILREFARALTRDGLAPDIVTGSGTGAYSYDAAGPYNELQVGSYVFMDADYARVVDDEGGLSFSPSLFVLASVVSVNRPGQVTVDAGTKALATNGPAPCHLLGAPAASAYRFAGDEHGIIGIPPGQPAPEIGARVLIGATHCDPTVNLHSSFQVVSNDGIEEWPILGRY